MLNQNLLGETKYSATIQVYTAGNRKCPNKSPGAAAYSTQYFVSPKRFRFLYLSDLFIIAIILKSDIKKKKRKKEITHFPAFLQTHQRGADASPRMILCVWCVFLSGELTLFARCQHLARVRAGLTRAGHRTRRRLRRPAVETSQKSCSGARRRTRRRNVVPFVGGVQQAPRAPPLSRVYVCCALANAEDGGGARLSSIKDTCVYLWG